MVRVLRRLGIRVRYDPRQTCCGQPCFNTGYRKETRPLALRLVELFESSDYVVAPSGSCTAMVRNFYPELFADDESMTQRIHALAPKLYEFSEFLVRVLSREDVGARFSGRVTYHDACHLLRELRVREEPRRLIRSVRDLEFVESDASDSCCGFGGTFAVKFPELSSAILQQKIDSIVRTGAPVVVASDSSCLMQIAGALRRRSVPVRTMHLAELLACE